MSSDDKLGTVGLIGASKRNRGKSPRMEKVVNWTEITDEDETQQEEEDETQLAGPTNEPTEINLKKFQIDEKEKENQELKSEIDLIKKQLEREKEKNDKQTDLIGKLREEILSLKKRVNIEENKYVAHEGSLNSKKQKFLTYKKGDVLINVQKGIENDFYYGYVEGIDDIFGFFSCSDVTKTSKSITEFTQEIESLSSLIMELTELNAKNMDDKFKPSILNQSRVRPLSYRKLKLTEIENFFGEDEEEKEQENVESKPQLSIESPSTPNSTEFDQKKYDNSIHKGLERKFSKIVGKAVTTNRSIRQQLIQEPSSELLDLLNPIFKIIKYNPEVNQNSRKDQKEFQMDNLFLIEKNINDPLTLKLKFLDVVHDYNLIFENSQMRQTFYELIHLGRRISFCYSPKFALQDHAFSSVILFDKKRGTAKVNLSSDLTETISIKCVTWNMKNQETKSIPTLLEKLKIDETDIFVICLQSLQDTLITSYFEKLEPEFSIIAFVISSNVCLIVLIKSIHLPIVTNIQYDLKQTSGNNNAYGLGGAIGVSFKFNETTFCFVGAHLNEDPKFRKINIMSIMNGFKLGMNNVDISQFNHLFWLGNLNFQLLCDEEDALEYIGENKITELLNNDSLQYDILTKKTFSGFCEGKITFLPNSKFDKNGKYVEGVKPSYNDRIIFKTHSNLKTQVEKYQSIPLDGPVENLPICGIFKCSTHRLYASCFSDSTQQLGLKFSKLYLTDMKGEVIKKPQLTVYGNFLETTSVKSKQSKSGYEPTINPELDGFEIPTLIPIYNDRDFLSKQFLTISISDLSLGPSLSENLIGTCVLPLTGLTSKKEHAVQFISSIQSFTQEIGNLNGSFQCKTL